MTAPRTWGEKASEHTANPGERPPAGSPVKHPAGRFVEPGEFADVAVLIVTYQSANDIDSLIASLRVQAADQRLRVVVADNASSDGTMKMVSAHDDVTVVPTGGNLGYAGGINAALGYAGDADSLLILNPDLELLPGCVHALRHRMLVTSAGIVVPRILDGHDRVYPSLHREPGLLAGLGDATFGSRWPSRPSILSETVFSPEAYRRAHRIDWASGAALLVSAGAARRVGAWDESFFLYSEETDFFRRARDAGESVWYEPDATVRHAQGASGSSTALSALMAVNRIRYARMHMGAARAALFRGIVVLHEAVRSGDLAHRTVLRAIVDERRWHRLPSAHRAASHQRLAAAQGAIIIPAHDEEHVLPRTLHALGPLLRAPGLDIILAANGCTDRTAEVARAVAGVKVLSVDEASKTTALNCADRASQRWPRLYLDADITITPKAVCDTLGALAEPGAQAARPPYRWDLDGSSPLVRSYYRARARIPSAHRALWGAGVYGLSQQAKERIGDFPDVTADDLWVDQQFSPDQRRIVDTDPVVVAVPRTARDLLAVLRRQARGAAGLGSHSTGGTVRELVMGTRTPGALIDTICYGLFAALSRRRRTGTPMWERDQSSRSANNPIPTPAGGSPGTQSGTGDVGEAHTGVTPVRMT